jgi:hypothetical protein
VSLVFVGGGEEPSAGFEFDRELVDWAATPNLVKGYSI